MFGIIAFMASGPLRIAFAVAEAVVAVGRVIESFQDEDEGKEKET